MRAKRVSLDGEVVNKPRNRVSGGETVVTQGSFVLKTELRKSSIGAGCCEVDHLNE